MAEVLIVTVLAGDSLSKIAKRHDTTVDEIMERNAIDDTNLLFVGQELVIDGVDAIVHCWIFAKCSTQHAPFAIT